MESWILPHTHTNQRENQKKVMEMFSLQMSILDHHRNHRFKSSIYPLTLRIRYDLYHHTHFSYTYHFEPTASCSNLVVSRKTRKGIQAPTKTSIQGVLVLWSQLYQPNILVTALRWWFGNSMEHDERAAVFLDEKLALFQSYICNLRELYRTYVQLTLYVWVRSSHWVKELLFSGINLYGVFLAGK